MLTRPEPTSNGNCDSWEFIVGKKAKTTTKQWPKRDTLQPHHSILFTTYPQICFDYLGKAVGELWSTCGRTQVIPHHGF
jgi:hypothetical protein